MKNYLDKFRLDGKVALVIGGAGTIGKEVCKAFATAGAKTVIIDKNGPAGKSLEKEMINEGCDVFFKKMDFVNIKSIEKNFSLILKKFKTIDIYINCAYPHTADWSKSSFKKVTAKRFAKNIEIQMISSAWTSRLIAETMSQKKTSGSIIHVGSIYGIVGQDLSIYKGTKMRENMTYSMIKGGIINLTRQMASYYGKYNIRVNTLCPGGIKGSVAGSRKTQERSFVKNFNNKVPLKRLGNAEEIASTALFLASEASSYISGATIIADGGWTAI